MKAGWKRVKLGEVSQLLTGFPFDGHKYTSEGIRVLRGENISLGKLRWNIDKRWNEFFARASEYSLHIDDIVIAMDGAVGRNRAMITAADLPMLIAQRVACVRAKDVACQKFLYYTILSTTFFNYVASIKTGSVISHVSLSQLADFTISLPPLSVQKRIAAVLGALDDKIELNRKMNKNLEEQAQALFKSWFVDFEPWGGKMPKEWKRGCVGDIAEVNPIRSLKKYEIATCVEMADLSTNCSYPDRSNAKKYNGGMKFKNGDTLMARITPCLENGKAAFVNFLADGEVGFGSTEYITLCSKTEAPNELFYFLVRDSNFVRYATLHMAGSSGRQRVSGADIAAYAFPLATEKFYRKIKPILETTMRMIAANAVESRKLAETRDALLPKLMSGEIEV